LLRDICRRIESAEQNTPTVDDPKDGCLKQQIQTNHTLEHILLAQAI
jgi:hypothetical protein